MTTLSFRIRSLEAFQDRLEAVNRRLVKHQLPEASISSLKMEFVTRPRDYWMSLQSEAMEHEVELDPQDDLAAAREEIFAALEARVTDLVHVVELDVATDVLRWNGHVLRGRVQREEAGDMITRIGDHDVDLMQYYGKPFVCSHCGTKRIRKAVWVFQREEDEALLTMGDACAQEYFGMDIQGLLEDAFALSRLGGDEDEEMGYGRRHTDPTIRGHLVAAFGASLISFEGYKSRKRYEDDCTSAQAVNLAYKFLDQGWSKASSDLESAWHRFVRDWWSKTAPRWEEFCQMVREAREWWSTQAPREDYLSNCRTAILGMNPNHAGFLVCAVWEFMKAKGLVGQADLGPTWVDGWLGEPKAKLQGLLVELVDRKAIDGTYGTTYKFTFRGEAGHCLIWFASSDPDPDDTFRLGMRFTLSGTVKKHDEWKGQKQTVLIRCKLALLAPSLSPDMAA